MDRTAIELPDGTFMFVDLDEQAGEITFRLEDETPLAGFDVDVFATVTGALALDLGAELTVPAELVSGLQQWARV